MTPILEWRPVLEWLGDIHDAGTIENVPNPYGAKESKLNKLGLYRFELPFYYTDLTASSRQMVRSLRKEIKECKENDPMHLLYSRLLEQYQERLDNIPIGQKVRNFSADFGERLFFAVSSVIIPPSRGTSYYRQALREW